MRFLRLGLASIAVAVLAMSAAGDFICPNRLPSQVDGSLQWGGTVTCDVPCPQNYSIPHTYPCNISAPFRCCVQGPVVTTTIVSYTCDELNHCKKVTDEIIGPGNVNGVCTLTTCNEGDPPGGGD